jgi:predicted DNA-binding WGR domain protein
MPTRTFILEGESKRFWDISWDGSAVEITSGKWGTQGRAREASFATAAARDAFIAAEIQKVEKKGYREIGEIAPAPDVAPPSAGKVATLRALVERRRRPAWLPRFEPGSDGSAVVRGPMTLDRDEAWPTCRQCGRDLTGLFELDLAGVPADHLRDDALVQLFWCEAWEESGSVDVCTASQGGWLARRHRRGGKKRHALTRRGAPFAIVDFTRYDELPPGVGDLRERFEAASQDVIDDLLRSVGATLEGAVDEYDALVRGLGLAARNEHKLGGFPTFVQEYERPFRHQIFQIEEKAPFDVNFGDLGAGHLLLGVEGAIEFTWASH